MDTTGSNESRCAGLCTREGMTAAHRTHHRLLRHRAYLLLGDVDLAEDAVQEAFLRAWRACDRFDTRRGEHLAAWLTSITRNVAIDMIRARAARPAMAVGTVSAAAGPVEGDHADTLADRAALAQALATIGRDQRTAILATVVDGRRYRAVADALGVPEGTVKTRVFHGLRRLRRELELAA
ncbi:RNA polymerase sigma factor [Pseudonocardia sp.]|uniref:RNA polymerase sigma factor n=1 Tax=Pseudonocardia sp. TaxID=60912 RepID=UPI003D0ADC41